MTAPADWFPGDPPLPGVGGYDWTGDGMDADSGPPVWDDALDGPVYPREAVLRPQRPLLRGAGAEQSVLPEAPARTSDDEGGSVSTLETVEAHTCVSVRCRTCGDDFWQDHDEFGASPHWPSIETAKAVLTGEGWGPWLWDDAGPQCPVCVSKAVCAEQGHDWGDGWRMIPGGGQLRYCDRCPGLEGRPPAAAAPVASGG